MTVRPVVDAVEREFEGRLKVIRVDILSPAGAVLAREHGAQFTPTFVLFDGDGREIWRTVYLLDPATLRERLP